MEYLNEENYQNMNKKTKIIGLVILLIGLCLLAFGAYSMTQASHIVEPKMTASNWYEIRTAKMHMESRGMFMIISGIFLSIVGLMVRFVIANQRKILAYKITEMMPLATEGVKKVAPMMTEVSKDIAKEMAPVYGEVAKEITKGIKEGMKDKE